MSILAFLIRLVVLAFDNSNCTNSVTQRHLLRFFSDNGIGLYVLLRLINGRIIIIVVIS